MADKSLCTIPDCGKKLYAHGWCHTHYMRVYRYGTLDTTMAKSGAILKFALAALSAEPTEDCIIAPAKPNAKYAYFSKGRVNIPAHRFVCEKTHGPPPQPDLDAAHNCGQSLCLNPRHIVWKTRLENIYDKERHGTMLRGSAIKTSKLVEADIPVIRSGVTGNLRETAEIYGVSIGAISLIRLGRTWKHI